MKTLTIKIFSFFTLLISIWPLQAQENFDCRKSKLSKQVSKLSDLVIMGEIHGTVESPAFFYDVVCEKLKRPNTKKIFALLEYPVSDSTRLKAYLSSSGNEEDKNGLISGRLWQAKFQDGRTSEAMYELLNNLRKLSQLEKRLQVLPFIEYCDRNEKNCNYESLMAESIQSILEKEASYEAVVLVGNYHAARTSKNSKMVSYLTVPYKSVDIDFDSGSYWACYGPKPEDCGEKLVHGSSFKATSYPSISFNSEHFDAVVNLGRVSASLPQVSP